MDSQRTVKRLNWKAIGILAAAAAAVGTTVHFVHAHQVKQNAHILAEEAATAEKDGKRAEAADRLHQYLQLNPDDTEKRTKRGMLLAKEARETKNPQQKRAAYLELSKVLQAEPGNQDVRMELARLGLEIGQSAEVRQFLADLRKAGKNDAEMAQLQARCEVAEGKYEAAARAYETATGLSPRDVDLGMERAYILRVRLNTPGPADDEVERVIRANEGATPARVAAARYYQTFGHPEKALPALTGGLPDAPSEEADVLLLAADLTAATGQSDAATRHAERGAKAHPKDVRFAVRLARLDLEAGRKAQALDRVKPALAALPKEPDEIWQLGTLLIDLGQPDLVETLVGQLDKDRATASWAGDYLRGRVALQKGNLLEARRALTAAAAAGPSKLARVAYLMLADCHERLGNPDQRVAACRKAVEADPKWQPARDRLATALAAAGKTNEAITEYRGVDTPAAKVELARLLIARTVRQPEAERRWADAEKVIAELPEPFKTDAQLLRAEVLAGQGKLADARKAAEEARDRDPKQILPWVLLAALAARESGPAAVLPVFDAAEKATGKRPEWVLARAGYWVRAGGPEAKAQLAALEAGLADLPDPGPVLVGLGDAYQAVGDPGAAERVWRQAADRRPNDIEAQFRLFGVALQKKDDAQAEKMIDQIAKLEGPGGPLAGYAEAAMYTVKFRQGGDKAALDRARQALGRVAASRPDWSRALLLDAELSELDGQRGRALEKYLAVIEAGDAPLAVIRRAIDLLRQEGRFAEARAVVKKMPESAVAAGGLTYASAALALLDARRAGGPESAAAVKKALEEARQAVGPNTTRYQDYLWLGEMALVANEPAEAEKAFRKARDLEPTAAEPWVGLVALLAKSDPKTAEAELETAKVKVPPDRLPRLLAACYEVLGRAKDAGDQYRANAAARPDDPLPLGELAGYYVRAGDRAKAEETFRRILAMGPKVPDGQVVWARRGLAVVLIVQGGYAQFREAIDLLDKNAAKAPGSIDDERTRALALATQQNHRKQAIPLLEKIVQSPSTPPNLRFTLAQLYDQDGQWDQAEAELQKLLAEAAPEPGAMAYYAQALLRRNEPDRAEPWVDRLAKAVGETFPVVALRARVLAGKNQPQDAVKVVTAYAQKHGPEEAWMAAKVLEGVGQMAEAEKLHRADAEKLYRAEAEKLYRAHADKSKDPLARLRLAGFLSRRERLAEALDLIEKARATAPAEAVTQEAVAGLRAGRGTDEQAARVQGWVDAAVAQNPTSLGLMHIQADLMSYRKQFDQAVEVYRRVLVKDPKNVIALNNLGFLLAFKDNQAAEGLTMLNAAIELAGPHPELLDTRATVLIRAGRPEEAVEDLKQALALDPSPVKHFHMATAQMAAGRKPFAVTARKTAMDAGFKVSDLHPLERGDWEKLSVYINTR